MEARRRTKAANYVAKYLKAQENNSSDEERQQIETLEFDDFEPFMVLFRHYRPELSETEKQAFMAKGLYNLRKNPHMPNIMSKMFAYDSEVGDAEKDLLSVKEKLSSAFFVCVCVFFFFLNSKRVLSLHIHS